MKLQNDLGEIRISSEVFTAITGSAATNCYGVKGMAVRSTTDGLVHLLKRESMAKGVKVYYNEDGTVSIELHIIVENGVNLMAVCRSIMSEVALCGQQDHRRRGRFGGRVRGLHALLTIRRKESSAMVQNIDAAAFQRMVIHAHAAISAQNSLLTI